MKISARKAQHGPRKLIGVKISTRVLRMLKGYAEYTDQPINRCVEELLDQAIYQHSEYPDAKKPNRALSTKKAWDAFLRLGRDATGGNITDASLEHDRYLYGAEPK